MQRWGLFDRWLAMVILVLVVIGAVMVHSASALQAIDAPEGSHPPYLMHWIYAAVGVVLLLVAIQIPYEIYRRPAFVWGMIGLVVVLLAATLLTGPEINGTRRWLLLPGGLRLQPSEPAKLAVVTLVAWFLAERGGTLRRLDRDSVIMLAPCGLIVALIYLGEDLGTSAVVAGTVALLLLVAGLELRYYLWAALPGALLFYWAVLRVPYRRERIFAFLDPEADPLGSGYHILQSLIAVGSGGWYGRGLAEGTQKLSFLPEPHTDFIFAVLSEELGLLGAATVVLAFVVLFWRGLRIAVRSDSLFGTYLALGITTWISLQAFINISVVLGLLPTKGIPLPLISYGGSSLVTTLAALGILLNISRQAQVAAVGDAAFEPNFAEVSA
ncbi:MAG: putative lipid II flippase FtsW [Acidobacteriota bacterium]